MKKRAIVSGLCLSIVVLFFSAAPAQAFVLYNLEPASGLPGDDIRLAGAGFDPAAAYNMAIGDAPVVIQEVREDYILFALPLSAASGMLEMDDGEGGELEETGLSFTVLREVDAAFGDSLAGFAHGYTVGTFYGDSPSSGPAYPVSIVKGQPSYVMAYRTDEEASFLALATDSVQQVELSAQSTALALVYMIPGVFDQTTDKADSLLALGDSLAEIQELITLIQSSAANGADYLEDPEFEDKVGNAANACLTALAAKNFSTAVQEESEPLFQTAPADKAANIYKYKDDWADRLFSYATGNPLYPRDLKEPGAWAGLNILNIKAAADGMAPTGLPTRGMDFDYASKHEIAGYKIEGSPVDWGVMVYELDPMGPGVDYRSLVDALEADNTVYKRLNNAAIASKLMPFKSPFENLDIVRLIANAVSSALVPGTTVNIPADHAGLYMVRQFSGAWFPDQHPLLWNLPGGDEQVERMTTINITMAAVEAIGFVFRLSNVLSDSAMLKTVYRIEIAVSRKLAAARIHGAGRAETIALVLKEAIKEGIRAVVKEVIKKGLSWAACKTVGKVLASLVNIPGKVVTVGNVAFRLAALTKLGGSESLAMVQGAESSVAIVGDPWVPEITSFHPRKGYRGMRVTINGRRFSSTPSDNIVEFSKQPNTSIPNTLPNDDPPLNQRATVVSASQTRLVVEIPEGAYEGTCIISVQVANRGKYTTSQMSSPFTTFYVMPDPVITGFSPDPPYFDRPMKLSGSNLLPEYFRNLSMEMTTVNGLEEPPYMPMKVTEDFMIIVAPFVNEQMKPVTINFRLDLPGGIVRRSNTIAYEPQEPPVAPGAWIEFTSLADNNIPDGHVTLREALGWATLGRDFREPTRCPTDGSPCIYDTPECEYITGCTNNPANIPSYGRTYANTVLAHYTLDPANSTVNLDPGQGALLFGSYDSIDLGGMTINGQMASADAAPLSNVQRIQISDGTFTNFNGNGVHLSGTSQGGEFHNLVVDNVTGDGFLLDGESSYNVFDKCKATNNGGNGFHLSGTGVQFNDITHYGLWDPPGPSAANNNDGWGGLIDAGASFNHLAISATENSLGGIRVDGAASVNNLLGIDTTFWHEWAQDINGNGGPGISVGASGTTVRRFWVYDNQGDGILVNGPETKGVDIHEVLVGFKDEGLQLPDTPNDGTPRPNLGSGIHFTGSVSESKIGMLHAPLDFSQVRPVYVGGNQDHGIWFEGAGVKDNLVTGTVLGPAPPAPGSGADGQSGVALTNGANNNDINLGGSLYPVSGHTNGAGVLFDGSTTKNNRLSGTWLTDNQYGAWVKNGARANTIGLRGGGGNHFQDNAKAGILLESGGQLVEEGQTLAPGVVYTPYNSNVVQNNDIYGETGVLIQNGGLANRIGGTRPGEGNRFFTTRAGIHINGLRFPDKHHERANRIIGNTFETSDKNLPVNNDPLTDIPPGVGVLITNDDAGNRPEHHVIGGDLPGERNIFNYNHVGIHVRNSDNILIKNNRLGSSTPGTSPDVAGVILNDCAQCMVGPGNVFLGNGRNAGNFQYGGLTVYESSKTDVSGNWFGSDETEDPADFYGNQPFGIGIIDSEETVIGNFNPNVVVDNAGDGVLIKGDNARLNQVGSNFIGRPRKPGVDGGNTGSGVHITDGADHNTVGGDLPKIINKARVNIAVGNTIAFNRQDGVRVDGASALGNAILNNSITSHDETKGFLGINNANGGNSELPPPVITSVLGPEVSGTVDAAQVADGALIQVFTDDKDEGETLYGETTVADGKWQVLAGIPVGPVFTATVTHLSDTSEFSLPMAVPPPPLEVKRVTDPPGTQSAGVGVSDIPIHYLEVRSLGAPLSVDQIHFDASGTLADNVSVTSARLYEDTDEDGLVGAGDKLLGGPGTFDANDGRLTLDLDDAQVGQAAERWLLVYDLAGGTPLASTFTATIGDADSITVTTLTGAPAVAFGPFPVVSDLFTTAVPTFVLEVARDGTGGGGVTSVPAGIDCGQDCSQSYEKDTNVTLTAAPDMNSTFTGWSDPGCPGTGECVVTMDSAKTVTATFPAILHTLTITRDGAGTGTVTGSAGAVDCGATCADNLAQGTQVTLFAAPDPGSGFTGWGGDADCADGQVTMSEDVNCTASFGINTWPTAVHGGPYNVDEGASLALDGSGSSDPDGNIVTYEWDLDNDGVFDTAGNPASFDATGTDGPAGPFTVSLKVTDNLLGFATATTTVTVDNVPPAADAGGPYSGAPSTPVHLSGAASDPAPADTQTYAWDLDDNGSFETSGQSVQATFHAEGTFTVGLQVIDDDGGVGTDSRDVTITGLMGDLTGDGMVDLKDAIEALQILLDKNSDLYYSNYPASGVDVNANGNIGLEEALYILRNVAEVN